MTVNIQYGVPHKLPLSDFDKCYDKMLLIIDKKLNCFINL